MTSKARDYKQTQRGMSSRSHALWILRGYILESTRPTYGTPFPDFCQLLQHVISIKEAWLKLEMAVWPQKAECQRQESLLGL